MDSLKNMTYWDAVGLINKVKNVVMNYSEWEIKVRDGIIFFFKKKKKKKKKKKRVIYIIL